MKEVLKNIPVIGPIAKRIRAAFSKPLQFENSEQYWKDRYKGGGNSGAGSYNNLAEHKGEVINAFVQEHHIGSVIEYGSGDGNQLKFFDFKSYTGFDISPVAIDLCNKQFAADSGKTFKLMKDYSNESADLTMSLDVIYHLIEDRVFEDYISRLFDSTNKFVLVYASNDESLNRDIASHVKHRKFTDWVEKNRNEFKLLKHVPNKYPFNGDIETSSFADFYFFEKG